MEWRGMFAFAKSDWFCGRMQAAMTFLGTNSRCFPLVIHIAGFRKTTGIRIWHSKDKIIQIQEIMAVF